MYLRSHNALLSREEHLKKIYEEELTPPQQAVARKLADDQGVTLIELLRAIGDDHDARMADPVRREELLDICWDIERQRAMPYGSDPQLEAEECIDEEDEDA